MFSSVILMDQDNIIITKSELHYPIQVKIYSFWVLLHKFFYQTTNQIPIIILSKSGITCNLLSFFFFKRKKQEIKLMDNNIICIRYMVHHLPFTHIGGAPVAFATRKDIAMSSQFLVNPFPELVILLVHETSQRMDILSTKQGEKKVSNDLFLVTKSLIDAGISFVYTLKYFLWKKAAFESTILYVPVHQTDHHPPYV